MNIKKIVSLAGWSGVLMIILAYSLNTLEIVSVKDASYHIINLIGALLITVKVAYNKIWSNVFLEVFWASIAVYGLARVFFL